MPPGLYDSCDLRRTIDQLKVGDGSEAEGLREEQEGIIRRRRQDDDSDRGRSIRRVTEVQGVPVGLRTKRLRLQSVTSLHPKHAIRGSHPPVFCGNLNGKPSVKAGAEKVESRLSGRHQVSPEETGQRFMVPKFAHPPVASVQQELEKIMRSPAFASSPNLCRFLSYIVDKSMKGRPEELKEYNLAVEVFGRR